MDFTCTHHAIAVIIILLMIMSSKAKKVTMCETKYVITE